MLIKVTYYYREYNDFKIKSMKEALAAKDMVYFHNTTTEKIEARKIGRKTFRYYPMRFKYII